ncbi:exodeoxyribonuclease VII large subunit [Simiduia sp. 21SJ11W-1]|uniref:exodeoxyribonuclease VII large subunit n=1 Tax=Simiduia sp. 21SJ11W-1 TaxID=2909669 RepID=UPI00209CEDC2|nr:exodeoxyribonuclease VII large subunit [Simiduia sp. 21SJ11W-1]UTA49187.1 exodeoxyribonuclease VII large subunit [Simiduia sp. 21SJ11W-1]
MPAPERQILTVTQLNRQARQLLETHLSLAWIEGEISNLAQPASGHCYFTLKDAGAQVRCAMFKNRRQFSKVAPANGMKVLIRGRVSLYEGRGDYQLIVEHMEDAGLGALQRAFDALRDKLDALGLFQAARKRPLPRPARHIAIITSRTGAALQDILSVFERRWPGQPLTLLPVAVQGDAASGQIIQAIERANRAKLFDVILLARGGGSLEDLWAFNDESLAHAIVNSELPVITGVGHETDTTIADFAADVRAPTPSAAAELLSPSIDEWLTRCTQIDQRLHKFTCNLLSGHQKHLGFLSHRLQRCRPSTDQKAQTLDIIGARLHAATLGPINKGQQRLANIRHQLTRLHPSRQLSRAQERLTGATLRLLKASPQKDIAESATQVARLQQQAAKSIKQQLERQQTKLQNSAHNLNNLSPLQTLQRGYAIATTKEKAVITQSTQVNINDTVEITLADGSLTTTVRAVHTPEIT